MLLLRELFADENRATASWENDNGHAPPVTWTPPPNGGAFAALLGLTGTGLLGEYTPDRGHARLARRVRCDDVFGARTQPAQLPGARRPARARSDAAAGRSCSSSPCSTAWRCATPTMRGSAARRASA